MRWCRRQQIHNMCHYKSPVFPQKNPVFPQKSPVFHPKSPVLPQKSQQKTTTGRPVGYCRLPRRVEILKRQLATSFTMQNNWRADFRKMSTPGTRLQALKNRVHLSIRRGYPGTLGVKFHSQKQNEQKKGKNIHKNNRD